MSPFRDAIRFAIFEKVSDESKDISQTETQINLIIEEYKKKFPNFADVEKINIELTVPTQLPPGGEEGDCKKVVDTVVKSFNELGGGSTIIPAKGSWLDQDGASVSDHCLIIFTSMLIKNWYKSIPVLTTLIGDEIQTKLYQKCVYLRIDDNAYGKPINLLGGIVESFPEQEEFGEVDSACIPMMIGYEEQISSGADDITAIGEGAIAVKGDVKIIQNQGIDPEKYAQLMAENMRLKDKLAKVTDEQEPSKKEMEELLQTAEKIEHIIPDLDPWELTKLGKIARLQGRYKRAIDYYRMALNKFLAAEDFGGISASYLNIGSAQSSLDKNDDAIESARISYVFASLSLDVKGVIRAISNIATIESAKGNFLVAEECYNEALKLQSKYLDEEGRSSNLLNLANIHTSNRNYGEAEKCIKESLDISRKASDSEGIVIALCNLGNLLSNTHGKYDEAEKLVLEAIEKCENEKLLRLKYEAEGGLANIYQLSGRLDEARKLYEKLLTFERRNGLKSSLVDSLTGLANIEIEENNLDQAERLLTEAGDIASEIDLKPKLAIILNNLGNTLCEQSKMERYADQRNEKMMIGRKKCTQAYELAKELGLEQDMVNPLFNLGCSLMFDFQENLYDRSRIYNRITPESYAAVRELPWLAEHFFREGLELSQKLAEKPRIASFLLRLGHVAGCKAELAHFLKNGQKEIQYGIARDFFQQALEIYQELGNSEKQNEVVELMHGLDHFK